MKFLVDVDGRVLDKAIVKSSGHKSLDQSALDATARCILVASGAPPTEPEWLMTQYVFTLD